MPTATTVVTLSKGEKEPSAFFCSTWTGVDIPVIGLGGALPFTGSRAPLPSCPEKLRPHPQTFPLASRTREWSSPAASGCVPEATEIGEQEGPQYLNRIMVDSRHAEDPSSRCPPPSPLPPAGHGHSTPRPRRYHYRQGQGCGCHRRLWR